MEVKELMINDWYYDREDLTAKTWSQFQYAEEYIDFIEPIPLTDEILELNNFTYHEDEFYWTYRYNEDVIIYGKYAVQVFDGEVKIRYVHQLQQLLRLVGENYLANNFKVNE